MASPLPPWPPGPPAEPPPAELSPAPPAAPPGAPAGGGPWYVVAALAVAVSVVALAFAGLRLLADGGGSGRQVGAVVEVPTVPTTAAPPTTATTAPAAPTTTVAASTAPTSSVPASAATTPTTAATGATTTTRPGNPGLSPTVRTVHDARAGFLVVVPDAWAQQEVSDTTITWRVPTAEDDPDASLFTVGHSQLGGKTPADLVQQLEMVIDPGGTFTFTSTPVTVAGLAGTRLEGRSPDVTVTAWVVTSDDDAYYLVRTAPSGEQAQTLPVVEQVVGSFLLG